MELTILDLTGINWHGESANAAADEGDGGDGEPQLVLEQQAPQEPPANHARRLGIGVRLVEFQVGLGDNRVGGGPGDVGEGSGGGLWRDWEAVE